MKKSLFVLALALTVLLGSLSPVTAEARIGTIDLRRVFDDYYKTKSADARLKAEAAGKDKQMKAMIEDREKLVEQYQKLMEKKDDQAISSQEREKAKNDAQKLLSEIKEKEQALNTFRTTERVSFNEQQKKLRDAILKEIRAVINRKAVEKKFTHILDVSAESITSTPVVIYSNGEGDITDEVLKELNANAPAAVSTPAPATDNKKK